MYKSQDAVRSLFDASCHQNVHIFTDSSVKKNTQTHTYVQRTRFVLHSRCAANDYCDECLRYSPLLPPPNSHCYVILHGIISCSLFSCSAMVQCFCAHTTCVSIPWRIELFVLQCLRSTYRHVQICTHAVWSSHLMLAHRSYQRTTSLPPPYFA